LRNVLDKQKCSLPGGLQCVYNIIRRNAITGEKVYHGCCLHSGDHYNIYPEFESQMQGGCLVATTGKVVNNDDNPYIPNDFKVGLTVVWENVTNQHEDGMNFDFRDFPADIHPLYHREARNVPIPLDDDTDPIGEIFGDLSPVLVSTGWMEESWYGHDRVEVCKKGIYGIYDNRINTTKPKCMKSYINQIRGWINYTNQSDTSKPKQFYACEESDELILEFCYKWFNATVAERIADGIIYVKNGGYINMWSLLENNFIDEPSRRAFMNQISLKSKKNLYKGSFNIQSYCALYDQIDKMIWPHYYTDESGEVKQKLIQYPEEMRKLFKENILNFIMNHPSLEKTQVGQDSGYKTSQRYWHAMMLFRRAKKEKLINPRQKLPNWLVTQYNDTMRHDCIIVTHDKTVSWNKATKEEKDDFIDAKILRVENAKDLYPHMERVEDIVNYHKQDMMWFQFCDILKAGRRWNKSEIQSAWEIFNVAYAQDNPSIFWDWVEDFASRPLEDEISINGLEVLQQGAMRLNTGDGNITGSRSFAANLIGLRTGCTTDSFDINKMPMQNWYEVTGRGKGGSSRNPKDIFWENLAKLGGLDNDDFYRERFMSDDDYLEATGGKGDEFYSEVEQDILVWSPYESISLSTPTGFSDSDIDSMCIYDSRSDDLSPQRIYSSEKDDMTPMNEEDIWEEEV
jgi:hypothetical protein